MNAEGNVSEEKRVRRGPRDENLAANQAAGTRCTGVGACARGGAGQRGADPGADRDMQAEPAPGARPRGGPGQVWLLRL